MDPNGVRERSQRPISWASRLRQGITLGSNCCWFPTCALCFGQQQLAWFSPWMWDSAQSCLADNYWLKVTRTHKRTTYIDTSFRSRSLFLAKEHCSIFIGAEKKKKKLCQTKAVSQSHAPMQASTTLSIFIRIDPKNIPKDPKECCVVACWSV